MHVFTHTFDYIALGILVACMLLAGGICTKLASAACSASNKDAATRAKTRRGRSIEAAFFISFASELQAVQSSFNFPMTLVAASRHRAREIQFRVLQRPAGSQ
jgi:hypothetical protein